MTTDEIKALAANCDRAAKNMDVEALLVQAHSRAEQRAERELRRARARKTLSEIQVEDFREHFKAAVDEFHRKSPHEGWRTVLGKGTP